MSKYEHGIVRFRSAHFWDFERKTQEAIQDLYHEFEISAQELWPSFDEFFSIYRSKNSRLMGAYRVGKVTKDGT